MKKQELTSKLQTLKVFLGEMKAIDSNPYSAGLKAEQLIDDLTNYVDDLIKVTEEIEEVSVESEAEPVEPMDDKKAK